MADKENVLSPEELDALAAGLNDGSIESDTGLNTQVRAIKHDLVNEESSKGINTSVINPINDRILVAFKLRLSNIIRVPVDGVAEAVNIQTYGEYMEGLKAPQAINIIRARPLHGEALVVINPGLISECFDHFFGGESLTDISESSQKGFTRAELRINNILMNEVFSVLQEAWAPIQPLTCTGVDFTHDPKKAKTMKRDELVLVSRFKLLVSQTERTIEIVYPYYALKSIRSSFLRPPSEIEKDDLAARWTANLEAAIMGAPLEITVKLAQISTTLKEFESLRQEDIVYFAKPNFAKVGVENTPAFEGIIGTQGSNMAVQLVTSLARPK
jgi:flagellar motor switch protein FliM